MNHDCESVANSSRAFGYGGGVHSCDTLGDFRNNGEKDRLR